MAEFFFEKFCLEDFLAGYFFAGGIFTGMRRVFSIMGVYHGRSFLRKFSGGVSRLEEKTGSHICSWFVINRQD